MYLKTENDVQSEGGIDFSKTIPILPIPSVTTTL